MPILTHDDIARLSPPERLTLIGALWDSLEDVEQPVPSAQLLELARRATAQQLPLEFVLIGESMDDSLLQQHGVSIYGRYRDSVLPDILRSERPHIVLQPSICPETWSFVASAALKQALPLYSFDIGAIADRLRSLGRDTIIPLAYARDADALALYFLSVRTKALAANEQRGPAETVS